LRPLFSMRIMGQSLLALISSCESDIVSLLLSAHRSCVLCLVEYSKPIQFLQKIMAPLVASERLLPFVILFFILIQTLGFLTTQKTYFLRIINTGPPEFTKCPTLRFVMGSFGMWPYRLLELFLTFSNSSNTILFMG